jgi:putative oxidoreductase
LGLLLLRAGLAFVLIRFGAAGLFEAIDSPQDLIAVAGGIFLIAGLWTPLVGAVLAVDQIWIALSPGAILPDPSTHVFWAVLSASLAMLGPGAWSIDARLFGRKRVDIDRMKR